MNINEIGKLSHDINESNGWDITKPDDFPQEPNEVDKVRFLCTHMALIHTEVSEATEAIRHIDPANFAEELADIIIRVTSVAHGMGIDLGKEVQDKLAVNRTRGFRHGGKSA